MTHVSLRPRSRSLPIATSRRSGSSTARSRRVPAEGDIAVIDSRAGLVDPSVDPFGYIWSVPRDQPSALAVFSAAGQQFAVADAWPGATQIDRDGGLARRHPGRRRAGHRRPLGGVDRRHRPRRGRTCRCGSATPSPLGALVGPGVGARVARRHDGRRAERATGDGLAVHRAARRRPRDDHGRAARAPHPSPGRPRSRPCDCAPRTDALYVKRGTNWQRTTSRHPRARHAAGRRRSRPLLAHRLLPSGAGGVHRTAAMRVAAIAGVRPRR